MADFNALGDLLVFVAWVGHGVRRLFTPKASRAKVDEAPILDFFIGVLLLVIVLMLIIMLWYLASS